LVSGYAICDSILPARVAAEIAIMAGTALLLGWKTGGFHGQAKILDKSSGLN
jgi:hypothetical protein